MSNVLTGNKVVSTSTSTSSTTVVGLLLAVCVFFINIIIIYLFFYGGDTGARGESFLSMVNVNVINVDCWAFILTGACSSPVTTEY